MYLNLNFLKSAMLRPIFGSFYPTHPPKIIFILTTNISRWDHSRPHLKNKKVSCKAEQIYINLLKSFPTAHPNDNARSKSWRDMMVEIVKRPGKGNVTNLRDTQNTIWRRGWLYRRAMSRETTPIPKPHPQTPSHPYSHFT